MEQKTAFVAIVGCPNVGKSSIMNKILGQKVAIVSPKPQTTRTRIIGVHTDGAIQLVFTDTPGIHRAHNRLGEAMNRAADGSIQGGDACLLVVEPYGEVKDTERELCARFKKENIPAVLAVNKIDLVEDKRRLLERIAKFAPLCDFAAVVPVSARTGDGMDDLLAELNALAAPSPHFFPDDELTDQPERVIAAEIVREKMLLCLDQEIPHGAAVTIERFAERDDGIIDISALIYCEKQSHKGIIIGKGGAMLKKIGTAARIEIERMLGAHVNLSLHVKVREGWRNRDSMIRDFGLEPGD